MGKNIVVSSLSISMNSNFKFYISCKKSGEKKSSNWPNSISVTNCTFWTKPLPQKRHLCSLVSVCIFSCLFNEPIVGNSLLQNLQGSPLNKNLWIRGRGGCFRLKFGAIQPQHYYKKSYLKFSNFSDGILISVWPLDPDFFSLHALEFLCFV